MVPAMKTPLRILSVVLTLTAGVLAASARDEGAGAKGEWWSLRPVVRPAEPAVRDRAWVRNPIDTFVLQKLEEQRLLPAREADRATFIRRATFDLIGLPPTLEEIDAFVADESPDAHERLIDRLLASPHYGERWARHWLDVARFGESDGFENDKPRDHAWRYRDYVIQSFNDDKPYNQFIKEQLAGDALEPITRDSLVATGFLVAGPWDEIQYVAKSKTEKMRAHEEQMEELLAAVSQTFLGMTVHCARCHDHKFDPIPQADYYRLKAVFDGFDHGNRPILTPTERQEHEAAIAPIQARIKELKSSLDKLSNRAAHAIARDVNGKDTVPATVLTDGRFGRALDARRGHLEAKSKSAFQEPPITVECWAKVNSKAAFNILVANNVKESPAHWEIYTYAGSGEFSAFLPGYQPSEIKSGVDITDGAWHHVAMSFDGSRVRLFVDGRVVKEAKLESRLQAEESSESRAESEKKPAKAGTPTQAVGSIWIGAYPPHRLGCDGLVDEVRISRGTRHELPLADAPPDKDDSTVGLWHLDEPAGARFVNAAEPPVSGDAESDARRTTELTAELKQLESDFAARAIPQSYSGVTRQPEPTFVFLRGDIQKAGPQVIAAALSAVRMPTPALRLDADSPEGRRRLQFAEWVASPVNPLTARVMVNRVWQYHFGTGLVDTPSDFGSSGGRPSHPELLDWLASEYVEVAESREPEVESQKVQPSTILALNSQPSTLNAPWSI